MASLRHKVRMLVVQALFYYSFGQEKEASPKEALEYVIDEFGREIPDTSFAEVIFSGTIEKTAEIDEMITKYAPEWPLEKIAKMDLIILRLGIFELIYCEDVPPLVAINEAVELAKEFGEEKASKFINGVLSNIAHDKIGKDNLKKNV